MRLLDELRSLQDVRQDGLNIPRTSFMVPLHRAQQLRVWRIVPAALVTWFASCLRGSLYIQILTISAADTCAMARGLLPGTPSRRLGIPCPLLGAQIRRDAALARAQRDFVAERSLCCGRHGARRAMQSPTQTDVRRAHNHRPESVATTSQLAAISLAINSPISALFAMQAVHGSGATEPLYPPRHSQVWVLAAMTHRGGLTVAHDHSAQAFGRKTRSSRRRQGSDRKPGVNGSPGQEPSGSMTGPSTWLRSAPAFIRTRRWTSVGRYLSVRRSASDRLDPAVNPFGRSPTSAFCWPLRAPRSSGERARRPPGHL